MTCVDHDQLRAAVNDVMSAQGVTVTSWFIAYETSAIDDDGDVGHAWGAVLSASQPVALGLCRLVARDIEHASTQED